MDPRIPRQGFIENQYLPRTFHGTFGRFSIRYLLCGLCASSESHIKWDERAVKTRSESDGEKNTGVDC